MDAARAISTKVNIYGLLKLLLIIMNAIVLFFVFFCL